ncbi:unnamed protein product [Blepharisma stoltei]|uniref:Uncharacterized protein n=1 Tax=Blepharisma stoltei TaxID=1481888 RepID=A0AAU9JKU6_9CILI|nr:unnamed protein product [Blepharisma stoltei]
MKTQAILLLHLILIASASKTVFQSAIELKKNPVFRPIADEEIFSDDPPNFIQLSSRTSEVNNDNLFHRNKLAVVGILSFISVLVCCGLIQVVAHLSKRTNIEYLTMKDNYKQYQGLLKFKEFYKSYSKENFRK